MPQDIVLTKEIGGEEFAKLLLAYALAADDFIEAAYDENRRGESEALALEELEFKVFRVALGREPTVDELRLCNPANQENCRQAWDLIGQAERAGYERIFGKPMPEMDLPDLTVRTTSAGGPSAGAPTPDHPDLPF